MTDLVALKELLIALLQKRKTGNLGESPLKKKRRDPMKEKSGIVGANAWQELLKSGYHQSQSQYFDELFGNSITQNDISNKKPILESPSTLKAFDQITIHQMEDQESSSEIFKTDMEELTTCFPAVFKQIHLLYEDLKLHKCHFNYLEPLADFLYQLALSLPITYSPYIEYYIREHPHLIQRHNDLYSKYYQTNLSKQELGNIVLFSPPDIMAWICNKLQVEPSTDSETEFSPENMPICYEQTRLLCRLYEVLAQGTVGYKITSKVAAFQSMMDVSPLKSKGGNERKFPVFFSTALQKAKRSKRRKYMEDYFLAGDTKLSKIEKILVILLEENVTFEEISSNWPWSFVLPIYDIIWYAREHPQKIQTFKWEEKMYRLIGREDIAFNLSLGSRIPKGQHQYYYHKSYYHQFSPTRNKFSFGNIDLIGEKQGEKATQQKRISEYFAGIEVYKELLGNELGRREAEGKMAKRQAGKAGGAGSINIAEFRFNEDVRYKEVTKLLDSSGVMKLRLENIPEQDRVSDEKFENAKQALLYKMTIRQLSKCVGRGALTYGTLYTLPTETLEIQKLVKIFSLINNSLLQEKFHLKI